MENLPIDWVHVSGYYDGPLDGWVRAGGRYLHFRLEDDFDADIPTYGVYEVSGPVRLPHLRHIRAFRHMVWWGWDWSPHRKVARKDVSRQGAQEFYSLPKPPEIDPASCLRIGVTLDLMTIAVFA